MNSRSDNTTAETEYIIYYIFDASMYAVRIPSNNLSEPRVNRRAHAHIRIVVFKKITVF